MAAEKDAIKYEPREWRDDRDGGTPIDAAALNRMEHGIADAAKGVNDINATLATYLVESDGEHATLDVNGAAIKAPCYVYDKAEGKTWFDSGVEDEPRVAPFPTRAELQEVRDSLSRLGGLRAVVEGTGADNPVLTLTPPRVRRGPQNRVHEVLHRHAHGRQEARPMGPHLGRHVGDVDVPVARRGTATHQAQVEVPRGRYARLDGVTSGFGCNGDEGVHGGWRQPPGHGRPLGRGRLEPAADAHHARARADAVQLSLARELHFEVVPG